MPNTNRTPACEPPIRLGVSACLLGERVCYDGGHRRDPFVVATLGRYVEWVPVCPEVEAGLGVPRESLRLAGNAINPRVVGSRSGHDYTSLMEGWADERAEVLASMRLQGFVLKKGSPSCGLDRVRVYGQGAMPERRGQGVFARALINCLPCLPVEEEGRLHDMRLRENWIERIFAYLCWSRLLASAPGPEDLRDFHRVHRLALLAHSARRYREMQRLVSAAEHAPWDLVLEAYGCSLTEALHVQATPARHARVLLHLAGHFRKGLGSDDWTELSALIADYRRGLVPLVVPLTLLQHHLRHHSVPDWIRRQSYLNPYPRELLLRNHV